MGGKEDELSEKARHFGSETWEREVLQAQGPVLVDFWATWCPPCRVLGPVIDELAGTYAGRITVGKVNVDENEDLALGEQIQRGFHAGEQGTVVYGRNEPGLAHFHRVINARLADEI